MKRRIGWLTFPGAIVAAPIVLMAAITIGQRVAPSAFVHVPGLAQAAQLTYPLGAKVLPDVVLPGSTPTPPVVCDRPFPKGGIVPSCPPPPPPPPPPTCPPFCPPAGGNDAFGDASVISSLSSGEIAGNNADATTEDGEPDSCGARQTLWYKYTSAVEGLLTAQIVSRGSPFAVVLAAYTGRNLEELRYHQIACSNQASTSASIHLSAEKGVTYYLQIGSVPSLSYSRSSGDFVLTLRPSRRPLNDNFESAERLDLGQTVTGDTKDATRQENEEPDYPCGLSIAHTIWYVYEPSSDLAVTADTAGSKFSSVVQVFTGTSLENLRPVETMCQQLQADPNPQKKVRFLAEKGKRYFLQVGSDNGLDGGVFAFRVAS